MRFGTAKGGFSLVETLVAVTLLVIVGAGVYAGFAAIAKGIGVAKAENGALALANERLEIVRGMPYANVGIVDGLPAGVIPREETVDRGIEYVVTTTVRSIDLPFDGTIGGSPSDPSPADQKLVEVAVGCARCRHETRLSTRVSPASLEGASGNGALFVQVVDAAGLPVEGAEVTVENVQSATATVVEDVTGVDGWLRLVDVPPGTMAYSVTVGKDGYSSARTYALGDPVNPVPDVPHANVVAGQVTQLTFAIDRLAALDVVTLKANCEPVGLTFDLVGEKQIGLDTPKYDERHTTGAGGTLSGLDLEWDSYRAALAGGTRYVSGANPPMPIALLPGGEATLSLVTSIANPNALLVLVVDQGGLPVAGATVEVGSLAKETGVGSLAQTDWSGGPGQDLAGEAPTGFASGDGGIDHSTTPGALALARVGSSFASSGYVESATFDTGTSTNFVSLGWLPASQPAGGSARFQIATAATSTAGPWTFVGPDGGAGSYYETPGAAIAAAHDGDRYLRYRAYLAADGAPEVSPYVTDAWFTYTVECAPAGQAYFSGLSGGGETVRATRSGYQTAEVSVPSWSGWRDVTLTLSPL